MDENPKKYIKVKEEENPDNLQEETTISSQSKFSEINTIQEQKNNKNKLQDNKNKFKYREHYFDKGNVLKYFYDKNGIPKIVIGPHCKNKNIILYL